MALTLSCGVSEFSTAVAVLRSRPLSVAISLLVAPGSVKSSSSTTCSGPSLTLSTYHGLYTPSWGREGERKGREREREGREREERGHHCGGGRGREEKGREGRKEERGIGLKRVLYEYHVHVYTYLIVLTYNYYRCILIQSGL